MLQKRPMTSWAVRNRSQPADGPAVRNPSNDAARGVQGWFVALIGVPIAAAGHAMIGVVRARAWSAGCGRGQPDTGDGTEAGSWRTSAGVRARVQAANSSRMPSGSKE